MQLDEIMELYPETKKEIRELIDINNIPWREMAAYLKELESLIENGASREEMLKLIDNHYGLTMWFRADGLIDEDEHWYDDYL